MIEAKISSPYLLQVPAGGISLPESFFRAAAEAVVKDIQRNMARGVGADGQLLPDNAANTRSAAGFAGLLGKEKKAGKYAGKDFGARTGWKRKRPSVMTGFLRDHVKVASVSADSAVVHIEDVSYPGNKYGTTTLMAANFLQYGTRPHIIEPRGPWMLRFPTTEGIVFARRVHHPGTVPRLFFGISPLASKAVLALAGKTIAKIVGDIYGE